MLARSRLASERVNSPSCEGAMVDAHACAADQGAIGLVERLGARDLIDEPQLQVILQVLAHARLIEHDGNAEPRELIRAADAGEFEDLHGADRASRKDDLAASARGSDRAVLAPAHGDRARALKLDLFDQAVELEPQIGALEHRLEEGARRRPAPPALLVDVEDATALVVTGVEIGDALDASLFRRRAEGVEDIPAYARRLDAQFAADRVRLALAEKMVLMPAEERQHVIGTPAGKPELAPMVVIGGLAAHVDHGVDGRGAAYHLAARIVEAAAVEARLRLGLEHPVRARIADGEKIPDGDVEPDPIVLAAGFEQQYARCRIGGEADRQ